MADFEKFEKKSKRKRHSENFFEMNVLKGDLSNGISLKLIDLRELDQISEKLKIFLLKIRFFHENCIFSSWCRPDSRQSTIEYCSPDS